MSCGIAIAIRVQSLSKCDQVCSWPIVTTQNKIRQLTWNQLYRDNGLKWGKVGSVKPPAGVAAIYSLRITRSRRATALRDGDFIRLLTITSDHDSTYGKK